ETTFTPQYNDVNRILINFGKYADTFYIDDIEFGYYEEDTDPEPIPDPEPVTPTGSLNNTIYFDGTQWCLMLEDFEGKTIGDSENIELSYGSDGTATVVADPLGISNNSLNFISGNYKNGDYYYIDITLPDSKTLSSSSFTKLIFDIVYNTTGDNTYKTLKVNIDNTSTELGTFDSGSANTTSWSQQSFDLTGKYTDSNTFRIYIGGVNAQYANLFIDNIRMSVPTTASGTCGSPTLEDVNWMYDENSTTLYISGKGDIADYNNSSSIPWSSNKSKISNIIIGEGITAIGKNNFYGHNAITSISLPSTLTKIGEQSFFVSSSETKLAIDLIIPEGVKSIGNKAFYSRNGLKSVVLPSTLEEIGSQGLYVNNGSTPIPFTFHSNPTLGSQALYKNSSSYTATLVLDDALSPFFAATSENTFNGGIEYKRTLSAKYSTITLPFIPSSGLENCTFYELNTESENNLVFEEVTNLVAGKPYMVKTELTEIDFTANESITIPADAVASETTIGTWTMHGTYSTLVKNSEDNAYGFSENALRRNTGTMTVKPFRAYFTTSSYAKDYLDVIFGGDVTGIERNEFSPEGITELFSLDGKKHDYLQKGLNIVRMNNGSIKKIVIK
ncbi:MAG: leucine-rich repeat domain-containing protein, partial [Prevotella sp.]